MEFDQTRRPVLDAAMKVHSALGAGPFEEVYKVCLRHELQNSKLNVLSEVGLPVIYDGVKLELG